MRAAEIGAGAPAGGAKALLLGVAASLVLLIALAEVAIRIRTSPPLAALTPASAQAPPVAAVAESAPPARAPAPPAPLVVLRPAKPPSGPARVLDTGALEIGGRVVRLRGVRGEGGAFAELLARWIAERPVRCARSIADRYVCAVGGVDLAELAILSGAARAAPAASIALRRAERDARLARRGMWADDDARVAPAARKR